MDNTVCKSEKREGVGGPCRGIIIESPPCVGGKRNTKGVKISRTQRERRLNDDGDTFHAALRNIN